MATRRKALQYASFGVILGVPGCSLASWTSASDGAVRPDDDPSTLPADLTCDDETAERHPPLYGESGPRWGDATDAEGRTLLELRLDGLTHEMGDVATITATNPTNERRVAGAESRFNFERLTRAGWQDVRVDPDSSGVIVYPGTYRAIRLEPNEDYEWSLELTEDGIVSAGKYSDRFIVCPDLKPGRYRFVLENPAVAVAFDLIE